MAETVSLTIPVYRTPGGRHTCAVDVAAGRFCPLRIPDVLNAYCGPPRWSVLERGIYVAEDGYEIPVNGCPVAAAMQEAGDE